MAQGPPRILGDSALKMQLVTKQAAEKLDLLRSRAVADTVPDYKTNLVS